ncbi:MAG: hypothetical protein DRP32_06550 [Thermotogae bacterium]|uniref:hypothetical protein n=1 Tax=Kosmotoga sp. TaxID=1955248 RepID=UPI000F0F90D0|nr:hypothetical protein [Kosmotoga sp.]MBO8166854.1 hypothetical protein [Kosmotoga sp.]RKX48752.1 MAG: hypothetical protein DRP32_06550 [Thermotogota bacterium]
MDLSFLNSLIQAVIENWYIVLPFSILMYFGARFFEAVTLFLVGAAIGFFYIFPIVNNQFADFINGLSESVQKALPIIVALIIAVAFLAVYKVAVFILVALAAGGLVYFFLKIIVDYLSANVEQLSSFLGSSAVTYIVIGVAIIAAIVGGIMGSKKSKSVFTTVSIILGSVGMVLSAYVLLMNMAFNIPTDELTQNISAIHISAMGILVILLSIFGLKRAFAHPA